MSDKIFRICADGVGHPGIGNRGPHVRAASRQQMAISRQFVLLGEVDKVVDARLLKSGKPCARIRVVGAEGYSPASNGRV
jgi:hypothetical protein